MSEKTVCDHCQNEIRPDAIECCRLIFRNELIKPESRVPWPKTLDFCGLVCAYRWIGKRLGNRLGSVE